MSNQQHPITPPAELIKQWVSAFYDTPIVPGEFSIDIAIKAARWGADQELEACCEWVSPFSHDDCYYEDKLRNARRPKPPSLKEQALSELNLTADPDGAELSRTQVELIRRALEALPND